MLMKLRLGHENAQILQNKNHGFSYVGRLFVLDNAGILDYNAAVGNVATIQAFKMA